MTPPGILEPAGEWSEIGDAQGGLLGTITEALAGEAYELTLTVSMGSEERRCLLRLTPDGAELRVGDSRHFTTPMLLPLAVHAWIDPPSFLAALPDEAAPIIVGVTELQQWPKVVGIADERANEQVVVVQDDNANCLRVGVVPSGDHQVVLAAIDGRLLWEMLAETVTRAALSA